jgi:hypothetical protein
MAFTITGAVSAQPMAGEDAATAAAATTLAPAASADAAAEAHDDIRTERSMVVVRITEGQAIRKVFAERIVCKSVAAAIQELQNMSI